jgi:hypothetical protein
VRLGSIETEWGWDGWTVPQGNQVWTGYASDYLQLEGFDGSMGAGYGQWFSSSLTLPQRLRFVLIIFAATDLDGNLLTPDDTVASFAYRYLENADQPPVHPEFEPYIVNPDTGIAYQDFHRVLPFAAYDVSAIPPRRLAVGFMENNVNCGLVDGKYWPPEARVPCFFCGCNALPLGAREFFFVFDADYGEVPDTLFQVDIEHVTLPIMWWGTPGRNGDVPFSAGDQFEIFAMFPFTSQDVWTFNPTIVGVVDRDGLPSTFLLSQNYPNPFNPVTTISYELPVQTHVILKVYNIIGQEVGTLVNEIQRPGVYRVQWPGTNNAGKKVASGVYFYRLATHEFVQTKKLVMLR